MNIKRGITLIILSAMLLFHIGCAYVQVKTPYDADLNQTELGTKSGTASAYSLFWLVSWGDASYAAAARNGGIKVMRHADQEVHQILFGLYSKWTVVVYGD